MFDLDNSTTGHFVVGVLMVLMLSPLFVRMGFPRFLWVLAVVAFYSIIREFGQSYGFAWWSEHEPQSLIQSFRDGMEHLAGATVAVIPIGLIKFKR